MSDRRAGDIMELNARIAALDGRVAVLSDRPTTPDWMRSSLVAMERSLDKHRDAVHRVRCMHRELPTTDASSETVRKDFETWVTTTVAALNACERLLALPDQP